jgi:hypothetical protein
LRVLRERELTDVVYGSTLLGSGGGGSPQNGIQLVKSILEGAGEVKLVKPEEVPDYSMVCVVAGMGAPMAMLKRGWENEDVPALKLIEQATGKAMDYTVAVETGGFNSVTPLHTAAANGIAAIDGAGIERAIPQLEMTMFHVHNIPIAPVTLADATGNFAVLYPKDPPMAETMARGITVAFGMKAGLACHPMAGWQLKKSVIPGTCTRAEEVGKSMREAVEKGQDPVKAVVAATKGYEIARGTVKEKTVETRGGFDYGKVMVADVRVDYKNENMIAWKAGKPVVISPDLTCWMTTDGKPLTNADINKGMEVAVIGIKAHERWRTPEGLAVYQPVLADMGYSGKYIPVEQLQK